MFFHYPKFGLNNTNWGRGGGKPGKKQHKNSQHHLSSSWRSAQKNPHPSFPLLKQRAHQRLPHGRSGISRCRAFAFAPGTRRTVGLAEAKDPLLPAAHSYIHHRAPSRFIPGFKLHEAQGMDKLLQIQDAEKWGVCFFFSVDDTCWSDMCYRHLYRQNCQTTKTDTIWLFNIAMENHYAINR